MRFCWKRGIFSARVKLMEKNSGLKNMKNSMLENDMRIISQLSENQKVTFMKLFARLAAANGVVDDCERDFIDDMAGRYGIPAARIGEIWQKEDDKQLMKEAAGIDNRKAALMLIKEMCILAHADDELSDEEVLFIGQTGEAMGVAPAKVEEISNWVIERIIWQEKGRLIFEEV